jgi:predicted ATPase/DNA-binding CsgD family transcriptional regulator
MLRYASPFIGRAKEVAQVASRLVNPDCRLLTITGLGGSGKTRLAVEAATTIAAHFEHGSVFVELQPLPRSELLVETIAQALGLTFYGEGTPFDQLLDYLQDKTLLLVLDNFEHLLDGSTLVNTLLAHAPSLTILITSREALHVQAEWLYPLSGLTTPPTAHAAVLENYEAVQLLLAHAQRVQPAFDLASEQEGVVRLCQLTAGLPLAITLAASWLKGSSAVQIAHEIQHNLDVLSTTTRNIEARHRSMRAVFEQSWNALGENERLVFARLCVFPSDFDVGAAKEVAKASFASLAVLVEQSFLQREVAGRWTVHELLRQYGAEQLAAMGETETIYERYAQYFARLVSQHEVALHQPQQHETMQAIERDWENIRLAWEYSLEHGHVAHLHGLLHGLFLWGFGRSRHPEIIALFQQTLDHPVVDESLRGRLLARRWGLQWGYQANYGEALTQIEQALAIAHGENNRFELAFCYLMAAYAKLSMQRYADALPDLETSRALFEAIGEPYYVCWVLHRLGYAYANLNDIVTGNAYTAQSLALACTTHNQVALVICLHNLGSDYLLNGDYVKGRQYFAEALQVATQTGHQGQMAHALNLLALCAFLQCEHTVCHEYVERAQEITAKLNRFMYQAYGFALLMLLASLRENYAEAVRLDELAQRHATNTMGYQLLHWARAVLACGLERPAAARLFIQQTLALAVPEINPGPTLWIVPCVAYTLAPTEPCKAVELLAWIFSSPDPSLHWARQWPLLGRLAAQLRATLDADAFEKHWQQGAALGFDTVHRELQQTFGAPPAAAAPADPQPLLTAREHDVLRLLAAGMTNPQIAAQLIIGTGTVKTHTLNIYRKLAVANRTQAIMRAQELGLLHA